MSTASPRDVIDIGARAIDAFWSADHAEYGERPYPFECTEREYQKHCRDTFEAALSALTAAGYRVVREGELDAAIKALRHFDQLYYQVSTEINPKGYAWHVTDDALEFVKEEHDAALRALAGEAKPGGNDAVQS